MLKRDDEDDVPPGERRTLEGAKESRVMAETFARDTPPEIPFPSSPPNDDELRGETRPMRAAAMQEDHPLRSWPRRDVFGPPPEPRAEIVPVGGLIQAMREMTVHLRRNRRVFDLRMARLTTTLYLLGGVVMGTCIAILFASLWAIFHRR